MNKAKTLSEIIEYFQSRFSITTNRDKIILCTYRTGHRYILNAQERMPEEGQTEISSAKAHTVQQSEKQSFPLHSTYIIEGAVRYVAHFT